MQIQKLTFYWVNAFIIRTDACTVLWDTGCLPEGETLPAFLKANGFLSDGQLRLPGESAPLDVSPILAGLEETAPLFLTFTVTSILPFLP